MPPALLLAFAVLLAACQPRSDTPRSPAPAPAKPTAVAPVPSPVVVVELFTSEGCSSCPPADALLGALAQRDDVLALSFHVDYWNDLGWRDPYSDAAISERQRAYGHLDGRVYTPQMVVNGMVGFVGSRRGQAEAEIARALDAPLPIPVALDVQPAADALAATYTVSEAPEEAVLHLALVQRAAEQPVRRGENRGRTLQHANVVRHFETGPAASGTATLPLPDGLTADAMRVVAYVQQGTNGPILGAVAG